MPRARAARLSASSEIDAQVEGDPFYGFGWAYGDPWDDAASHLYQLMNPALQVSLRRRGNGICGLDLWRS